MSSQYSIYVKIKTKPITRILRFIPFPFYVHGHNFKISISIKNLGSQTFNGGTINIFVRYAFGNLKEQMSGTIPLINSSEEQLVDFKGRDKWGVLAHGHALFYATINDLKGNIIPLCDEKSQPLQIQPIIVTTFKKSQLLQIPIGAYHVHSFYSLTRGEIYTLIALYLNVVLIVFLNYDKLVEIFRKVLEFMTQIIN